MSLEEGDASLSLTGGTEREKAGGKNSLTSTELQSDKRETIRDTNRSFVFFSALHNEKLFLLT